MPRTFQPKWPHVAARLAGLIPRSALHPVVLAWADSNAGPAHCRQAIAFSGGADSLALLLLVWSHWPEHRKTWMAVHFNHRLRGRAADADAVFCRRVCDALDLPLADGKWEAAVKGASEAQARTARMDFFQHTLSKRRIRALWLGHQQDDIAETLLMRLARGSGTSGLAAPRPIQLMQAGRVHLRPLLTLKKQELIAALQAAGAVWREDQSNRASDYTRNRLRHEVMPAWLAAVDTRDALAGAALSRERLDEDDQALDAWVEELALFNAQGHLHASALAGKPRAISRRALHRWLLAQKQTGDLSRQGFEQLLTLVEKAATTRFSLGKTGFAVIRQGWLFFEKFPRSKVHSRAN